jgi:hypothetical protein
MAPIASDKELSKAFAAFFLDRHGRIRALAMTIRKIAHNNVINSVVELAFEERL